MTKQKTVSISQLRANFSKILRSVERGWEVTITKHEKPIAKLIPIKPKRPLGMDRSKIWMADDLDGPLRDDLLKE